ncbi:MAG: type II toxin-antitoxin system HicA family toxin [Clostridia bacterium]|nr:type II toxin-antitoxin system HicA family toxin [Clostridia bacterium]
MGKNEKAVERLKARPADYTFKEAKNLLIKLGFTEYNKGKTSGSRVAFIKGEVKILLHKPHPEKEMKKYAINQLIDDLEVIGEI